ncbi:hypothetical protein ACN47E_007061 [Coniothyrium glycines]
MSHSHSAALTKRNATSALMPPRPAPKRIKRPLVVLDEDTYTSAVSHIIRRDFFPGLAEADAQREYLDAVDSKDQAWIREAGKNLTKIMTPRSNKRREFANPRRFDNSRGHTGSTPREWSADTPVTVQSSRILDLDDGLGTLVDVDLNLSLGAFQAKYTSEDQESFSQIIDKQNKKSFDENPWLREGNKYASKQRLAQQKILGDRGVASDSQALVSSRPSQNLDDRPAAPCAHKHTAFNSLMFNPESVEIWASTRAQEAERASLAPPKNVQYNNTRFTAPEMKTSRPPSPTMSTVRDAVAGRPRLNLSDIEYTGNETPRVNGYAFVDALAPEQVKEDEPPAHLLDQYALELGNRATSFAIRESSAREKMHHRMVHQIGVKRSKSSSNASMISRTGLGIFTSETPRFLSAPTPNSRYEGHTPSRRTKDGLTPAAQRLLKRVGDATPKLVGSAGFDKSRSGNQWSATPKVRKKG